MGTYIVVDGNSLTYRAFFALPTDMATASGQVTNAVFGFTSMLINVLKDHKPDGVLVTFDRPEPTFRHEAEPEYKANAPPRPTSSASRWGSSARCSTPRDPDDRPGRMGGRRPHRHRRRPARRRGARRDHRHRRPRQLPARRRSAREGAVQPARASATTPSTTRPASSRRPASRPALYPQYAALRGDPSDNLPGVPGVGEKTAAKLITTYGGLDGIFANVDAQTPKLRVVAGRARGAGAQEPRPDGAAPRRAARRDRPRRARRRARTRRRSSGCSTSSSSGRSRSGWPRRSTAWGRAVQIAGAADRQELVAEVRVLDDAVGGGRSHRGPADARRRRRLGGRAGAGHR